MHHQQQRLGASADSVRGESLLVPRSMRQRRRSRVELVSIGGRDVARAIPPRNRPQEVRRRITPAKTMDPQHRRKPPPALMRSRSLPSSRHVADSSEMKIPNEPAESQRTEVIAYHTTSRESQVLYTEGKKPERDKIIDGRAVPKAQAGLSKDQLHGQESASIEYPGEHDTPPVEEEKESDFLAARHMHMHMQARFPRQAPASMLKKAVAPRWPAAAVPANVMSQRRLGPVPILTGAGAMAPPQVRKRPPPRPAYRQVPMLSGSFSSGIGMEVANHEGYVHAVSHIVFSAPVVSDFSFHLFGCLHGCRVLFPFS